MSFLVCNTPIIPVYVKKEYLYDLEKGHGELTPGVWITAKSVMGKALYFETLLTDYGALFDKLPISAFVWKEDYNEEDQLPLDVLQIWDCFDYDITIIRKSMLSDCQFFGKDKNPFTTSFKLLLLVKNLNIKVMTKFPVYLSKGVYL